MRVNANLDEIAGEELNLARQAWMEARSAETAMDTLLANNKRFRKFMEQIRGGKVRLAGNYHGRLPRSLELEIIQTPDAIYQSAGKSARITFRKGGNVVVMESKPSSYGNLVTSYGPSGPRGPSGAKIFGGSPDDLGLPVSHADIINGNIPTPGGGTLPPASQIFP